MIRLQNMKSLTKYIYIYTRNLTKYENDRLQYTYTEKALKKEKGDTILS